MAAGGACPAADARALRPACRPTPPASSAACIGVMTESRGSPPTPRQIRRASARQAGPCPRPPHVRNEATGQWRKVASRCGSRKCPSCGVLWAGDTRVKILANVEAYGGDVALVTITAPGKNVLPHSMVDGRLVVEEWAARRWNKHARQGWRAIHRKASQRAQRFACRHGEDWRVLARVWQYQARGVLHAHVILPMSTPVERMASQIYAETLHELSGQHGFGYVDRGRRSRKNSVWSRSLEVIPAGRAARYVAKYVAGVKDGGALELTETVSHDDVPGHVVYVSRRLTQRTHVTMRTLRRRRLLFVLERNALDCGAEHLLDELTQNGADQEERIAFLTGIERGP